MSERRELEREIGRSLATQLLEQRDQLRQQVEKLLGEMTHAAERLALADEAEWGDDFEAEVRAVSQALTKAVDEIRREGEQ